MSWSSATRCRKTGEVKNVNQALDRPRRGLAAVRLRALNVTLHRNLLGRPGRVVKSRGGKTARLGDKVKQAVVNPLNPGKGCWNFPTRTHTCHNPHPQYYQLELAWWKHYSTPLHHNSQDKMPREAGTRLPKGRSSSLRNLKLERAKLEFCTFCMFCWQ
jgi:hypothetical protein